MNFIIVTFRLQSQSEVHERMASSIKIDGKGQLILYDKDHDALEYLTPTQMTGLSIEAVRTRDQSAG